MIEKSRTPRSLSNEAVELVDANGLARDALGRTHSHANPRPRNRPVKNANARLRMYEFCGIDAPRAAR